MPSVCHIYACNAKSNSGDFMIGIATKKYFEDKIINTKCKFVDIDCRNNMFFNENNINKLNDFDYILVGAGGLILPDSANNNNSCWQWNIHKDMYNKINKPLYIISIGYNLFFNQKITMYNRHNNDEELIKYDIFKDNIIALINKAKHFTLRHHSDVNNLLNIIGDKYKNKIKYEMCPTVWYVNKYWKDVIIKNENKYIAIEIKDDREWRRYYNIGKNNYYNILKEFIIYCTKNNINICYLSHDGSKNFYNFLKKYNINIPYLDNSIANEEKIKQNYNKINTILCSAGHSQMISYGLGIKIISLVSHPKLKNFCNDINDMNYIDINDLSLNILNEILIKI